MTARFKMRTGLPKKDRVAPALDGSWNSENQPRSISAMSFICATRTAPPWKARWASRCRGCQSERSHPWQPNQNRVARNGKVTNTPENRFHERGLRHRAMEINLKSGQVTLLARAARERQVPATRSNNGKAWDRLYVLLNFVALPVVAFLAVLWLNGR